MELGILVGGLGAHTSHDRTGGVCANYSTMDRVYKAHGFKFARGASGGVDLSGTLADHEVYDFKCANEIRTRLREVYHARDETGGVEESKGGEECDDDVIDEIPVTLMIEPYNAVAQAQYNHDTARTITTRAILKNRVSAPVYEYCLAMLTMMRIIRRHHPGMELVDVASKAELYDLTYEDVLEGSVIV